MSLADGQPRVFVFSRLPNNSQSILICVNTVPAVFSSISN